ncbi:hypothetical protein [Bythopirellula polymerisocia]|uniref:Uncharacterized protein n=1 Tax=Bythopirellula polymerisocia TaxID=2528003 RepID=A0A5C6BZV5_9BACT|nr:hypothetical protein [Bythopirellula polymerisocia]TWU17465.1 hypothetical protein Pla144_51180 [Bythopirellula polymerisocia]
MELSQRQNDPWHCSGSRRISPTWNTPIQLHRIAAIMEQEDIKPRVLAGRLGTTPTTIMKQADPTCDMLLSDLYQWQAALRVPIAELLMEPEDDFSSPILLRTRLLKLMRFVRSIQEQSTEDSIQTIALQMAERLVEMMPELKETPAWPSVGQRRTPDELGAIAYNVIPEKAFPAPLEEA